LATAINTLLAAVQNNVTTQKRFIGDAAHQLRTPLAGLKSQTEIALQSTNDPELRARLQRVHDSATRSAHLVNQLLTLARAEPESAMVQDRQRFDLNRLAHTLTAEWVPRALRLGVDLGVADSDAETMSAAPVCVVANRLLIGEALSNVIDNALHYAGPIANAPGGPAPQVTVRVRSDEGRALLEVLDNGTGIAQADQARVFERFVRATDSGNGCGLGLAIVKEIIERHGGEVRLSDASPHGLHVRMWLPKASPE
jgi:two-component system sensor histidine kinase TctE